MSYLEDNGTFNYAGIHSEDYGIWIRGSGTYDAPRRRHESIIIPGRDGALTMDNDAFDEVEHVYPAFIARGFENRIRDFRNAIMTKVGYQRLEDSYHPDEFYLARYMRGLEVDVAPRAIGGSFTLEFERDPRRFLLSGEEVTTLTSNGSITNPTLYPSKPLIRVYGTGTLGIGSQSIRIIAADVYTDIDCEMQDAFKGQVNCNSNVEFSNNNFPTIPPGQVGIRLTNITKVEITPRWYRL